MGRSWCVRFIWIVGLVACSSGASEQVTRTDSANVLIVENAAPDRDLQWTVHEQYRLGGADEGPEAFTLVEARLVDVDSSGNIYVLDPLNSRVVTFTSTGEFRWMAGQAGEGPGELGRPYGLAVDAAGQVYVADAADRTLSEFDQDGAYVQQLPWFPSSQFERGGGGILTISRDFAIDDGRFLDRLVHYVAQDTVVLATHLVQSRSVRFESCGFPLPGRRPVIFSTTLSWHAGQGLAVTAAGAAYVIDVLEGSPWRVSRSIRRALPVEPATETLALAWAEANPVVIRRTDGECITSAQEVVEKTGYADWVPLVADVRVSPTGTVWVRRYTPTPDSGQIDVFDGSGVYMGSLPPDFPWPVGFLPDDRLIYRIRDPVDLEWLGVGTLEDAA